MLRARQPRLPAPRRVGPMILFLALLAGCGGDGDVPGTEAAPPPAESEAEAGLLELSESRTWSGLLPCASCPGIQTTLQLRPDGGAQLLEVYLEAEEGEDRAILSEAEWAIESEDRLVVRPEDGGSRYFRVEADGDLRGLDRQGEPIESDHPLLLERLLQEGPLEAPTPGSAEDNGDGLLDREWTFVELGTLPLDDLPAPPHLVMGSADGSLSGSTGCNRLMGSVQLDGDRLSFTPAATTRMACPEPADEIEAGVLEVLERTFSYRIVQGSLELLDADDGVIARLEPSAG